MDDFLDVHIGTRPPTEWDRIEEQQADLEEDSPLRRSRPQIAAERLAWSEIGLQPRWVGDDTSQAVAAIDPSIFHGHGAEELDRFCRGAAHRSELALFVWSIGDLESDQSPRLRSIFGSRDSVHFPMIDSFFISGTRIRLAAQPSVAEGLSNADRDLALRLAQRPPDLPWWSLVPTIREVAGFFGTWTPLLTTAAGEVVAGVWTDTEGDADHPAIMRHYVLPTLNSYRSVLHWLAERAIPDLLPSATRRSLRYVPDTPELQTTREQELQQQVDQVTRDYEAQRALLIAELAAERGRAQQVREPLLFGTGTDLETAVARVLTDAGLHVTPLDPELGTKSADLLVELADRWLLVEVKSSSGRPAEALVDAARRHLRTWPKLRGDIAVAGVVLVLNHQNRLSPAARSAQAYERREFIDSLDDVAVVTTPQLFDWWRKGQWAEVHFALGYDIPPLPPYAHDAGRSAETGGTRPWWRRRR